MKKYEVILVCMVLAFLRRVDALYTLKTPLSSWKQCPAIETVRVPSFLSQKYTILSLKKEEYDERIKSIQERRQDIEAALDVLEYEMTTASLEWIKVQRPILNEMMIEFQELEKEERELKQRKEKGKESFWDGLKKNFGFK